MAEYSERITFDWSQAKSQTDAFVNEALGQLESRVQALVAQSQSAGRSDTFVGAQLGGVAAPILAAGTTAGASQLQLTQVQAVFDRQLGALTETAAAAEAYSGALQRRNSILSEQDEQSLTLGQRRLKALENQVSLENELAANLTKDVELAGEATALRQERIAAERAQANELLATTPGFTIPARTGSAATAGLIENSAYSKVVEQQRDALINSQSLALSAEAGLPAQQAGVAVQKLANDLEQRVAVSKLLLEGDQKTLQLKAEEKVFQEQVNAAYEERLYVARQNAGLGPVFGPPVPPEEGGATAAEGAAGGAAAGAAGLGSVGRLATGFITAIAVARVTQGIAGIVKDASQLNKEFELTKQQFDALGDSDGFNKFRDGILQIARDTGVSTVEVAQLGRELKGAFSGQSDEFVQQQIKSAAQLIQVTGASKDEINNQLVAISESFGVNFQQIGDKAAGLGQRFGVETKEIVTGLGSVASVAKEAGLSLDQTAAFITTIGVASGRGGAAIAESFGRILPEVSKQSFAIVQLFQQAQAGDEIVNKLIRDASTNQPGQLYLDAVLNANKLDASQQEKFASLFGPRQAFVTLTAINQRDRLDQELQRPAGADDGKLNEQYAKVAEQLNVQFAKLVQQVEQLGIALLNSGLKDVLTFAVQDVTALLSLVAKLVNLFEGVNHATHGVLGDLIAAAAVIKGIEALGGLAAAKGAAGKGLLGAGGGLLGKAVAPIGDAAEVGALGFAAADVPLLGGALGFAASPLGVGLAIGGVVVAYNHASSEVNKAADGLRSKIDKQLQGLDQSSDAFKALAAKIQKQDFSGLDALGATLLGVQTPGDIFHEQSTKERVRQQQLDKQVNALPDDFIKSLNGFQYGDGNELTNQRDDLKHPDKFRADLVKRLLGGDSGAEETAKAILAHAPANIQLQVQQGVRNQTVQGAIDQFKVLVDPQTGQPVPLDKSGKPTKQGGVELGSASLASLSQQYSGGEISVGKYLNSLQPYLDIKKKAEESGQKDADFLAQADKAQKQANTAYSKALKESVDLKIKILESSTGDNPQAAFDAYNKLLDDPSLKDPQTKFQVAEHLAELGKKIVDQNGALATTAAGKIAALRAGILSPKGYKIAELEYQIGNLDPEWSRFLDSQVSPILDVADFTHQVATIAVNEGVGVIKGAEEYLEGQITAIEGALTAVALAGGNADVGALTDKLGGAQRLLDFLKSGKGPGDYRGPGNFADTSGADKASASANKDEAKNAALAQIDIEKARAQDDAVRQAQLDVQRADIEAQYAQKGSEALQAEAAKIKAQRALTDAVHKVMTSQIDLAIAVATAAGDTVTAAQDGLKKAQDAYDTAKANGAGDAELNTLQVGVVSAAAAARDADLQKKENDVQFQLDMKKITAGQAIAMYQQFRRIPTLTDAERQDIDRQIRTLQQQAGADLKFNLPTELGLPTLYEARRINQTQGIGSATAYADNRVITISIDGAKDPNAVVSLVVDAINAAPRYGTRPRQV